MDGILHGLVRELVSHAGGDFSSCWDSCMAPVVDCFSLVPVFPCLSSPSLWRVFKLTGLWKCYPLNFELTTFDAPVIEILSSLAPTFREVYLYSWLVGWG